MALCFSRPECAQGQLVFRPPVASVELNDTGEGVCRFDGSAWTTYTTADGLASNDAPAVGVGSDGVVWIGTSAGLSRFVPED